MIEEIMGLHTDFSEMVPDLIKDEKYDLALECILLSEDKYKESEKAGHDVGIKYTVQHFRETGKAEMFKKFYEINRPKVIRFMRLHLGLGDLYRVLNVSMAHQLIGF